MRCPKRLAMRSPGVAPCFAVFLLIAQRLVVPIKSVIKNKSGGAPLAPRSDQTRPAPEIVPTAIRGDQHVGLLRPPAAALVRENRGRRVEHWGDGGPGGLDRVLSCEQRTVARHCVAE